MNGSKVFPPIVDPFSPKRFKMSRQENNSSIALTKQIQMNGGTYYFGSQTVIQDKIMPLKNMDGAEPRKLVTVKPFSIDIHSVTNEQFMEFVLSTNYPSEAELYRWSFVFEGLVSDVVRAEVDSPEGLGRVKDARHWMAVPFAAWSRPFGRDSDVRDIQDDSGEDMLKLPVVHVSYNDAVEYCAWVGRRLPTEHEWEFAARGGRNKQNYPWGDDYKPKRMNVWEGNFPQENLLKDGFYGLAPAKSFPPNDYGLYNMLGNVWEWVKGGTKDKRILRGGSFIDSIDGKYNHLVLVSTRQVNTGDSTSSNAGFRCANSYKDKSNNVKSGTMSTKKNKVTNDDIINLDL